MSEHATQKFPRPINDDRAFAYCAAAGVEIEYVVKGDAVTFQTKYPCAVLEMEDGTIRVMVRESAG